MFGRGILFAGILTGSFFVPYCLDQSSRDERTPFDVRQWWSSLWSESLEDNQIISAGTEQQGLWSTEQFVEITRRHDALIAGNGTYLTKSQQPFLRYPADAIQGIDAPVARSSESKLTGPEVGSISDIIRLDVRRSWVMDNWARVSTYLMDRNLEGLRVPIVSGTSSQDIAGSLTYFFDHQQLLQRVTFEGHTGDPSPLIALVTKHYGLCHEPSLGPGMFMARKDDQIVSALRIGQDAVTTANRPFERYQIMLELNRSDTKYGLSDGFRHVLKRDRQNHRWLPASHNK